MKSLGQGTPKWIVPRSKGTMVSMISLAILLAVGHHLFYNNLMGKPTPDLTYTVLGTPIHLSWQQINITVGTLLAFLVKAFLGVAVSTAHEQHVWWCIKRRPTELAVVDGLFMAKSNVFTMFTPGLWKKSTVSMLLALVFWLLPIASFLTPASLTVHQAVFRGTRLLRVPRTDFTSLNFAIIQQQIGLSPSAGYGGSRFDVQRMAVASTTSSQILPIPPPYTNSSWVLNFAAPALSCQNVSGSLFEEIRGNIKDALTAENCTTSYGYLSWVPRHFSFQNASLPFDYDSTSQRFSLKSDTIGPNGTVLEQPAPDEKLSIFFAAIPDMSIILRNDGPQCDIQLNGGATPPSTQLSHLAVAQCWAYNASYSASFSYTDGNQDVRVSLDEFYSDVIWPPSISGASAFGRYGSDNTHNTTMVEQYSFAAVMDAYGKVLVGSISFSMEGLAETSQITSTALMSTRQLGFLKTFYVNSGYGIAQADSLLWDGLSVSEMTNSTDDWLNTIEQMFQNVTMSLMASELLRPNYSSPYAPDDTLVTTVSYGNIYVYSKLVLWAPYATAIFFSIICIAAGTLSAVKNDASYTTKFSTVLRVAHILSFSSLFREHDVNGEDPTPDDVGNIEIEFPNTKRQGHPATNNDDKIALDDSAPLQDGSSSDFIY
ncbi:hypothetical protein F5Y14DRAFT_240106 [Nemania sp. NC0429]|nr:hypothetical protein F5Y14DRAFT_240106 [Nemania sp. NC0429]